MVEKTDLEGIRRLFPEMQNDKNWWPIIPKEQAIYYALVEDNEPLCFIGVVYLDSCRAEIQGLYSNKKSPTAVFELIDWIGYKLMNYNVKIYVINEVALWGWKKIGFKVLKSKKMKYWTAYWVERRAINGTTTN